MTTTTISASAIERQLSEARAKLSDRRKQHEDWTGQVEQLRSAIGIAVADGDDAADLRRQLRDADDAADSFRRACEKLEADIGELERDLQSAREAEARDTAHAERDAFALALAESEAEIVTLVTRLIEIDDRLSDLGRAANKAQAIANRLAGIQSPAVNATDRAWTHLRQLAPGTASLPRFLQEVRTYARERGVLARSIRPTR